MLHSKTWLSCVCSLIQCCQKNGAIRYANNMREEIKMLAVYADCYGRSTSITLRQIHPKERRMVSHNRRWIYVFHIDGSFVIVDRILPSKMNKG